MRFLLQQNYNYKINAPYAKYDSELEAIVFYTHARCLKSVCNVWQWPK